MFSTTRLLITVTALIGGVAPAADTGSSESSEPAVVIVGMTHDEEVMTRHALDLFAQAGLQLPPLEIRRHLDRGGCNHHDGLHRMDGQRSTIDICTTGSEEWEQRTILHELGHAWSMHFLTADHRTAFQQLRGWTSWLDYDHADWEDNGAEQAAEIVAWGLAEQSMPVLRIEQSNCEELRAGYLALTGFEPLNGRTDRCQSATAVVRS